MQMFSFSESFLIGFDINNDIKFHIRSTQFFIEQYHQ